MASVTIHTVGHSTHAIDDFVAMLRAHGIERVVDVRTVPRSRRNPQFGQESLRRSLAEAEIDYSHMKALGGLRKPAAGSVNAAWRNAAFRGYADHMQTAEFGHAVDDLIARARQKPTAVMCAEAVPWRCHRSLLGDALLARGVDVVDIMSTAQAKPHELTSFARIEDGQVTYPAAQPDLPLAPR